MIQDLNLMKSDPSFLLYQSNLNLRDFEESLLEGTMQMKDVGISCIQNSGDSPTRYAFSGNSEFEEACVSPVI